MSNNSKSQDILDDILLIQSIKDGKLTHCPKCNSRITNAVRNSDGKMVLACRDYETEIQKLQEELADEQLINDGHKAWIADAEHAQQSHVRQIFILENTLLHFCDELGFDFGSLLNVVDTIGGKYPIDDTSQIKKIIEIRCKEVASKIMKGII